MFLIEVTGAEEKAGGGGDLNLKRSLMLVDTNWSPYIMYFI